MDCLLFHDRRPALLLFLVEYHLIFGQIEYFKLVLAVLLTTYYNDFTLCINMFLVFGPPLAPQDLLYYFEPYFGQVIDPIADALPSQS